MRATLRIVLLCASAGAVVAFGGTSVAFYRSGGDSDRTRSLATLRQALQSLDDATMDPSGRLASYSDGLARADVLLCRAIRRSPVDTASIERLALVRWESEVLRGSPDAAAISSLMRIAGDRAPRVPEIQANLGDLFCKMGRPDDAVPFLRRAVELSPSMTNRAVASLTAAAIPPSTIVEALPQDPEVLIAIKPAFFESGQGVDFLELVERRLAGANPSLLMAYGEACLQLGAPARLKDRITALPPTNDRQVSAERACQAAHGWHSLGDANRALTMADEARRLAPLDPRLMEFYGEIALAAGRGADAEAAFRRSLELILTEGAGPARRARLYEALGRSLESQGRADVAYDAFRRAVDLDPNAANASERLAAYERSAMP